MASLKITLFESKTLKDGSHPIMLRIIHNRKIKYINLNFSAKKDQWNSKTNQPNRKYPNHNILKFHLSNKLNEAEAKLIELSQKNKNFTIDQLKEAIEEKTTFGTVLAFWQETIQSLQKANKKGNASAYKNTYGVFSQFRKNKDFSFSALDYKIIKKFEQFLLERNLSTNGISFHMRTLRAVYNRAVKEDLASKENYPFDKYSIKKEKTKHRALTREEISAIKNIDVSDDASQQLAKDYFMFSFYMRGINFIDMAFLKVNDIHNNRLNYKRSKSKDVFSIEIPEEAMKIILRYNDLSKKESYIFPAIKTDVTSYTEYRNAMRLTNKKLKKIGEITNCSIPLTSYVARHSWATIAKRSGISTAIISESLGHETEEITQVYLNSFENADLDEANRKIIGLI